MTSERHLVLWIPDWPVRAVLGAPPHGPAAVLRSGTVLACSPEARAQGVRRGQRRRVAQTKAPEIRLIEADPSRDERAFLPVLRLLEDQVPGVQPMRPGLAALRARGAARYYGGEEEAARTLIQRLEEHGYPGVRIGAAEGLFTAEQAARLAAPVLVITPGASRDFLAPLPLRTLVDADLATLFARLGVRTLGDLAALGEEDIRNRFGEHGVRLRDLASGVDPRPLLPQRPDREHTRTLRWDAPLTHAEQVAFAVRRTAEALVDGLAADDLVCAEVRIAFTDDDGTTTSRTWMHPAFFEASDLVDRVRWQLEGFAPTEDDSGRSPAGIVEVRIVPTRVESSAPHQPGLFGQGPEERVHHAVSRVQAILGHRGVLVPDVSGGRRLADRQRLIPWGDRPESAPDATRPWPGSLPSPLPTEIFDPPAPIDVTDAAGGIPHVDGRGALSAPPAFIAEAPVRSWAGPWPLREHSWDPLQARTAQRFQIVDAAQRAWLLLWENGAWWVEGRYS